MLLPEKRRFPLRDLPRYGISPSRSILPGIVVAACCLLPAGCGSGTGLQETVPISGTVSYKGQPLTTGMVRFVPQDENSGQVALGAIQPDGSFVMKSSNQDVGVVPGTYFVAIVSEAEDKNAPSQPAGMAAPGGSVSLIPAKYANPTTSGLQETIDEGGSEKTVKYELTD